MSTTDEIPQQPHITVPEVAPATEEPVITNSEPQPDQTVNQPEPESKNDTVDVIMSEAPVEVNETSTAPQPETVAEKPAEKPTETPISVPKEDSVKEESSAGKKKKKNKANLQEKLKLLNDKLNRLNAINKKIESKTGVSASPVLLPLATPALPQGSLALSGTGEDELSDSKKRKTRPNTLYDDYEIDATSRPLKKIGVAVGASPPPMMPQYAAPTTPIPVAPKKAHTPRGRGRPVGRPRGSGQHATYAQPGTYEPEWDEDYEDYEVDNDFDSFSPKGVGRPPKVKRPPRPQPRPVVPVVPYTPVAATLIPPPGRKRQTGQYVPLSAPLQQCAQIATALMKHPMSPPFNIAVDPLALGIPDYWTIIKEPMDLGTIKNWVDGGAYKDIYEFADDVRLVWRNALTYNAPGSQISVMAQTLADFFEQKFNALINRINNPGAVQSSPVAVEPVHITPSPQPATVQRVEVDPAVLQRRKEMQETLNDLRGLLRSLDKQVTELKKQTANLPQPPSAKPKARATRASATRPPPKRRPRDLNLKPMSYEEKCKLSDDINTLSSDHWAGVMAVIEEEMPQALKNDAEEVELDIDALDIVTLRRLEAFIAECQGKPAAVAVTQAPTATPVVPSPPVPPREPKVKKPKDDEAKQKPKRQPRKKTGPPQSITEETIRETERQLKAVNQSLTTGNASLKNIGDLESKQQSNKEALTRPKKGSHSSSSSDSSDSSDTDSDSSDEGSGDEGVKKKKKDKHQSTGGKAPMTKATEGDAGEETAAPKILTPTSPLKKEVVLQNVESWTALDESKPEEGDSNSTGPNNDSLWSEFRTKGQQNKQRMKEREDLEEKQRLEREKKERELKEEEERVKRELREKQEEEERKRMEEMQRRREQERLQREQQSGQAAGPLQSSSESAQSTILQSMTEQSEMLHSFEHQLMGGQGIEDAKLPLKPVDDEEM